MAVTLGATITGAVFPGRHVELGPFQSSAGNYYFVGIPTAGLSNVTVWKTSDPISGSWAEQASASRMAITGSPQAICAVQNGDLITVSCQGARVIFYREFNMATDAWSFATETAASPTNTPTAGAEFVSHVIRSSGFPVIFYNGGTTGSMTTLNMCQYVRRTATNTYSAAANVDNGGSVSWLGPIAALGASDRVHFFFRDTTNLDSYQRTLSSANVLETFPAAFDTSVETYSGWALSYVDGGTTRVRRLYYDTNLIGAVAKFDSADTPTVTTDTAITGTNRMAGVTQQGEAVLVVDGTTLHVVYSSADDSDLWHNSSSGGGGAWGTDAVELAGTIGKITGRVYTRSGNRVLGMVLDNGGTIQYAEIALTAAVTASLIWATETPYRILSRR